LRLGEPEDGRLVFLGTAFSEYIDEGNAQESALCLIRIEERALVVLGTAFSEYIDEGNAQESALCLIRREERAIEVLRG
jgi:hypothetical protein